MKGKILWLFLLVCAHELNAQTVHIAYDPLGRLEKIIYPDSSSITYTYDNNGNLIIKQTHDPCSTKPKPVITPLGPIVFCHEDTLQLTTEPALQYHWSTGDTTQTIKVTNTGDYTVMVIDSFKVFDDTLQCQLTSDSIAIYVKPLPGLTPITDQVLCNGDTTLPIIFSSTLDSTVFYWSGSTSLIGLAPNGSGNIPSFTVTNTGTATITDTIIVTPFRNDCYGKPDTFTLTVHPTPVLDTISNQVICNGLSSMKVLFNSTVTGTQFSWTNSDTSIGLAGSGSDSIPSFITQNLTDVPVTSAVIIVGVHEGCSSSEENFTITVNPTPNVDSVPHQVLCNGFPTTAVNFTGGVNGSAFNWSNNKTSIGLSAAGSNTIPAYTAINTTNVPVVANIIVTPEANQCAGQPDTFTITVNPTPSVNSVSNQVVCNGESAGNIIFAGSVAGTTYNWSNNKTSIGLSSSGTDSIASFMASNPGSAPITATISVSPVANNCFGFPADFTITVNPTPTVNTVASQSLCNNANTSPVNFKGLVSNTTYHWTNSNNTIGLDSFGTGNIGSFKALNLSSIFSTATITVTPKANNCAGPSKDFTITVKPTPTVESVANQVVCNSDTSTKVIFTGSVTNSTYTWVNNDTTIGLGAGGIDSIQAFIAFNLTNAPRTTIITTTPTANGCTGQPKNFSIIINPTPSVNTISDFTYCNGDMLQPILFTGSVNNTSFHWTNTKISIGLDSVGVNTIGSFIIKNFDSIPAVANILVVPRQTIVPAHQRTSILQLTQLLM